MRFCLIDRICAYEPGVRLKAIKNVALAEEYLADHFPSFPVLPGVFMLEALTQAGAWLVRLTEDFAHSMVVLQEARNLKFADFVAPGNSLEVEIEWLAEEGDQIRLKGKGLVDGRVSVSGRLVLKRFNLADTNQDCRSLDRQLLETLKSFRSVLLADTATAQGTP